MPYDDAREPVIIQLRHFSSARELREAAESGSTGFFDSHESDVLAALRALEQLEADDLVAVVGVGGALRFD